MIKPTETLHTREAQVVGAGHSEHAINESLPKSSRILTRLNDPLSVQQAFPNMRNGQIQRAGQPHKQWPLPGGHIMDQPAGIRSGEQLALG